MPHPQRHVPRLREQILTFIARMESGGRIAPGAGVGVAVVQGDETRYADGFGWRDRENRLPATAHSIFAVSSLTKAFTAALFLRAQEQGLVRLDKPLNSEQALIVLKDEDASRELTLEDVLAHRAGLPSHDCLWYLAPANSTWLSERIARLDPIPGAFRNAFNYSNLLYGALGHRLGDLTGNEWNRTIESEWLGPLGMRRSSVDPLPASDTADVAWPYAGTRRLAPKDVRTIAAAGALNSTAEDLTSWLSFQLKAGVTDGGARLLSEASIRDSHQTRIRVDPVNPLIHQGLEWLAREPSYALGWFVGQAGEHKALYHPGLIDGYSAAIVLVPALGLGIAVMVNQNLTPLPGLLIREIVSEWTGRLSEDAPRPAGATQPAGGNEVRQMSGLHADLIVGCYEDAAYGRIEIVAEATGLQLVYGGCRWPLRQEAESSGSFVLDAFGLEIPLPVDFGDLSQRVSRIRIPFSLDPRVAPQTFVRA